MKKYSLIFLLMTSILLCSAQEQKVPNLRKNRQTTTTTTQTQTQAPSTAETTSNKNVSISSNDYGIIQKAIENAFLVVRQSYNIRKNGALVDAGDYFGHHYTMVPLLKYGYGLDRNYNEPWLQDKRYAEYASCKECLVTVDRVEYKRLSEKKDYEPFKLDDRISDTLAPGYYHVHESAFDNKGLGVQLGNGVKSGYMVWFTLNNSGVSFTITPLTITYNENLIFNLPQPAMSSDVIGGFFINLDMSNPGVVNLNLLGVARLDPYGGGYWELVKMQKAPVNPYVDENGSADGDDMMNDSDRDTSGSDNSKKGKKR